MTRPQTTDPGAPIPGRLREVSEAFFVVTSLSRRSGGLTRAILQRVRLLDAQGIRTTVLVLKHAHAEDVERVALRLRRTLPRRTKVRYFWREGAALFPGDLGRVDPAGVTRRTVRNRLRRVQRVESLDTAGRVVAVEHRSLRGTRVAVDRTDAADGGAVRHHVSGARTWMSVREHLHPLRARAVVAESVGPRETTLAAAQGRWVAEVLGRAERVPVLFVDGTDACLLPTTLPAGVARVVSTLHNPHTVRPWTPRDPSEPHWDAVLRRTGAITRVVVLTRAQQADVLARYGEPAPTVVNNCVVGAVRPIVSTEPRLAVVGRLTRQKRVDHAIRAFATVAAQVPAARLDVVGEGSRRDALVRLAAELGVAGQVVFHGFRPDAHEILGRARAGVLSSWHEGMPLVLLEAMQAGTPYVAYDVAYGPGEIIRHGVDGLLVPPGDVDALGRAMLSVLRDAGLAARLGAAAQEVGERFSPERYAQEWLGVYREEVAEALLEGGAPEARRTGGRS
ncbi:MAG: glycosyltransferase [Actinotalea sp.]|nr:glycosyltransferase [Actinotalea sp.]